MVDVRRGPNGNWHVAKDRVGIYIRAYESNAINISIDDAIEIAHAILDLVEFDSSKIGRIQ